MLLSFGVVRDRTAWNRSHRLLIHGDEGMLGVPPWLQIQIVEDRCPFKGVSHAHGDDQSALCSTIIPDSTLKEKSQSIACHLAR